jgi:hypothetical protein
MTLLTLYYHAIHFMHFEPNFSLEDVQKWITHITNITPEEQILINNEQNPIISLRDLDQQKADPIGVLSLHRNTNAKYNNIYLQKKKTFLTFLNQIHTHKQLKKVVHNKKNIKNTEAHTKQRLRRNSH